ncbi:hypothetical protein M9434_007140 [Picochlorum sp. BPE23]|nr:hypothetical protein M9434_007140 [Picochlorum sp. BPE23]
MSKDPIHKTRFIRELQCNRAILPQKSNEVIKAFEEINQQLYHGLADNDCLLSLVRNPYDYYQQLTSDVFTSERWLLRFIKAMIYVLREPSFLLTQQTLDNGEAMQWQSLFLAVQEYFYDARKGLNKDFASPADPRKRTIQTSSVDSHDDDDDGDSHTTHMECQGTPEREEPAQPNKGAAIEQWSIDLTNDDSDVDVIDLTESDIGYSIVSDMEEGELQ